MEVFDIVAESIDAQNVIKIAFDSGIEKPISRDTIKILFLVAANGYYLIL